MAIGKFGKLNIFKGKGKGPVTPPAEQPSIASSSAPSISEKHVRPTVYSVNSAITTQSSLYVPRGVFEPPISARIRPYKSTKLDGEYEKPWLQDTHYRGRERMDKIMLGIASFLGFALMGYLCYDGWTSLPQHDYCLIVNDDFSTFDESIWTREVGVGGFGYGSFDWVTASPNNSYVDNSGLHIVPTLTTDDTGLTYGQINNNYTVNLTATGECTSGAIAQCVIQSNQTNGTIINPVRSARLTTAGKASIKYGRIEVVAKMPVGDWLWPSIWMYPENETYGAWPRSGEIDIAHVRGNSPTLFGNGRDTVTSTAHWGGSSISDQSARTTGNMTVRRNDLSVGWHTFGLEWSETDMFTWVDQRTVRPMQTKFGQKLGSMYTRADYDTNWVSINGTYQKIVNAWDMTARYNTPFDQPFHLILNVAVGAQNAFFDNSQGNKPWADGLNAPRSFWQAQNLWLPTWGKGDTKGMTVKSVKMWQQGKCGTNRNSL